MCMLCVKIQKDKLTAKEIARNYREINDTEIDHWIEIIVEINKKGMLGEVATELSKLREKEKMTKEFLDARGEFQKTFMFVNDSEKLVIHYAELPPIDASRVLLFSVKEPVWRPINSIRIPFSATESLEEIFMAHWIDTLRDTVGDLSMLPENIRNPKGVELVECDLMVPKGGK